MNKAKFSAKREIAKLDKFCRAVVMARDGGKCQICGRGKPDVAIHWAHVQSRSKKSTRWHLDNSLALCYYHHFRFAHEQPLTFAEMIRGRLGEERYNALIMRSNTPMPLSPVVVHGIWSYLSDEAQKYGVRLP